MIGPTGCGKTEISRRLAKLADAPFVKVEATKFTEVGYVGRDVEQIARDLVEEAVRLEKERRREAVREAASEAAMERLLDALTGKDASQATREAFRQRLPDNNPTDHEGETEVVRETATRCEVPEQGGQGGEAVRLEKERRREAGREAAAEAAMERLLDALTGKDASQATREAFRQRLQDNHLNDKEVEIEVVQEPATPFEIPGMGGQVGMINLSDMMGKAFGQQPRKKRKMRVADAWAKLIEDRKSVV